LSCRMKICLVLSRWLLFYDGDFGSVPEEHVIPGYAKVICKIDNYYRWYSRGLEGAELFSENIIVSLAYR
jgi:hypothetical protein